MDGFAGFAVKNEHQRVLADDRKRGDRLAALLHVKQARCGGQVGVPKVVVDDLEVPHVFAGGGIHGDDGIPVEIVAGAIASVIVASS
jgi:hypothetical protein